MRYHVAIDLDAEILGPYPMGGPASCTLGEDCLVAPGFYKGTHTVPSTYAIMDGTVCGAGVFLDATGGGWMARDTATDGAVTYGPYVDGTQPPGKYVDGTWPMIREVSSRKKPMSCIARLEPVFSSTTL